MESAHSYRLQKISDIQNEIEQERDKRADLSNKYHRSVRIVNIVDCVLIATTMGAGIAGIGVLSTIISAPIAIALEAAALGAGAIRIIVGQINKKLTLKAVKHESIRTLAGAKLNTISDHVSKALKDEHISDEEYALILGELERFNTMKEKIRTKETAEQSTTKIFENACERKT